MLTATVRVAGVLSGPEGVATIMSVSQAGVTITPASAVKINRLHQSNPSVEADCGCRQKNSSGRTRSQPTGD